jgi:hypothetical protein
MSGHSGGYGQSSYTNEYGRLIVKPITGVIPVRDVRLDDIPRTAQFDLETAEQIVLITENRHSQIVVKSASQLMALVIHESPSTCWVAQITLLEYCGPEPSKAIERERWSEPQLSPRAGIHLTRTDLCGRLE